MGLSPRRRGKTDGQPGHVCDPLAMRGVLHDLGHELTTLSYLVEALRGDASGPGPRDWRMEMLSLEVSRMLDIVGHGMAGMGGPGAVKPVPVRAMVTEVAKLATLASVTEVALLPGPEVMVEVDPVLLRRVLSNVIGNAVRAAGPGGRVVVTVARSRQPVIEVTDDGPGFGVGPPGSASLGLAVVTSLLAACGGSLAVESPPGRGTRIRLALPAAGAHSVARRPAVR